MNKIFISGRLTDNIKVMKTKNNKSVATFSIAVNDFTKNKGVNFFKCEAWGKTSEIIEKNVKKGDKIFIEGKLISKQYQNKNNIKVNEILINIYLVEFEKNINISNSNETIEDIEYVGMPEIQDDDLPF